MKLIKMKCENCGADLEVNSELDKIHCNFCGAEVLIDDNATELRRVEEVKLEARQKNHEQTLKEKNDLYEIEKKTKQEQKEKEEVEKFRKSKFFKFLILFIALCLLLLYTAFHEGKILSAMFCIFQIGVLITSILMGLHVIKEKFNFLHTLIAIIGILLIFPYSNIYNAEKVEKKHSSDIQKCETIKWDDLYAVDKIIIKDKKGEVNSEYKNALDITLCEMDKKEYENYRDEMIEKGYTIEPKDDLTSYIAYNQEGYRIYLNWDKEKKTLEIDLDGPKDLSEITWPTTGLATKIPKPESSIGRISWDNEKTFGAYIGNTSKQEFENYIIKCQEAGFTNDHSKSDKNYTAKNNDGYKLSLTYEGFNVIYISIDAPSEKKEETNKPIEDKKENNTKPVEDKQNNNDNNTNNNGLRTDFKNAMDSYESFMNEYVDFMKKYNANPSDYTLLKEYSNYLTKYSDFTEKFNKWNSDNMNEAETKYYIEVQTRVNKKLLEL